MDPAPVCRQAPDSPAPATKSLRVLAESAKCCQACDLYRHATQTVFGEGPRQAPIMLVGEQPGDQEDRQGHPFVGPAGNLLHRALADAGISNSDTYVTNAVKHFKFEERGKRRIHQKPNNAEIDACRPWLEAEIAAVHPGLIVALGATAVRSLLSRTVPINANRGKLLDYVPSGQLLITTHPSAILRVLPQDREREYGRLVDDFKIAAKWLKKSGRP